VGYAVKKDKDYKSAENQSSNRFNALPAGPYAVSIQAAELGEYGPKSTNAGRPLVNVQFRILDGQTGANRRVFQKVGIFEKWAPTSKNPGGADNFTFFQFFAAVTGKTEKEFRAWFDETDDPFDELPSPSQLEGRKLVIRLKVVPDTYGFEKAEREGDLEEGETQDDYTTNDISGFKVYDGNLPAAGAANTESPKVAAVDL
jgi:hypothetical protein